MEPEQKTCMKRICGTSPTDSTVCKVRNTNPSSGNDSISQAWISPQYILQPPSSELSFFIKNFFTMKDSNLHKFVEIYTKKMLAMNYYCGSLGCPLAAAGQNLCCRPVIPNTSSIFPPFVPRIERPISLMNSKEFLVETACYPKCAGKLSTLHLRKAKLMFFYVRYPASSLLKSYFPDVSFDKKNTAQLVKWFSNFREFFYTRIERHARCQSVNESSTLELYQNICSHYNRYKRFKPPENFRKMMNTTLDHFIQAVSTGRDSESSSWKKSVYKIVAKLDETSSLPPDFKIKNFPSGFYESY
uniref:Prospero domain-containing protein n=1 Tax=Romanomermis culicivorax TaxID=13658 RepID=A0A915L8N1_ROMCU